jgi:hypothetical protein
MGGHVARTGVIRNTFRILVGTLARKRPLEKPRRRWEDTIRMDLKETEWEVVDWIYLAQDRNKWRAH